MISLASITQRPKLAQPCTAYSEQHFQNMVYCGNDSRTALWIPVIYLKPKHVLGFLRLWKKIISWSNCTNNHLKVMSTFALLEICKFRCTGTSIDQQTKICWWQTKKFLTLLELQIKPISGTMKKVCSSDDAATKKQSSIYKCSSPLGKPETLGETYVLSFS